MDVSTLMKLMLSSNSTSAISKNTGASADKVSSVLNSVMPMLLNGATAQATNKKTAESFAKALNQHSARDTRDIGSFFGSVDQADGMKIFRHLLGDNSQASITRAAQTSGTSEKEVEGILSMASPFLMSVLGQQQKKHSNDGAGLMQALLGGGANSFFGGGDDLLGAAAGLLGGGLFGDKQPAKQQKEDTLDVGDVLGLLGKFLG